MPYKNDITIFYQNNQLFSKINLSKNNYLVLLKSIDLELLNYYQNIVESYNAINSIDQNKKNIQRHLYEIGLAKVYRKYAYQCDWSKKLLEHNKQ